MILRSIRGAKDINLSLLRRIEDETKKVNTIDVMLDHLLLLHHQTPKHDEKIGIVVLRPVSISDDGLHRKIRLLVESDMMNNLDKRECIVC